MALSLLHGMKLNNLASFLISTIAIVIILVYGKNLLIPFVFAVLLWFIIRELREFSDKITFVKKHIPAWLKNILISVIIIFILGLISQILTNSINTLAQSYKHYESNVQLIINQLNEFFHVNLVESIKEQMGNFDFSKLLSAVFAALTDIFSNTFIIIIYALFVFLEEAQMKSKMKAIVPNAERYATISNILNKIETSVASYIGLKTLVSFCTGILSYLVLLLIGIDSPVFWAFLIFALNFIPTIGSLVATLFPAIFCLLQFGEITPSIYVLIFVGAVQVLVGNIIEPKIMGDSLNVSPLVAIISLSFWGALWGITGMILSIPITVIMIIIFSQFEKTKAVAILLSAKGEIK